MANLKQVSVSVAFRSVLERCHDFLVSHTHTDTHTSAGYPRGRGRGKPPSSRPHASCLALIVCIYFCFINKIVSFEPSLLLIKRRWAVSLHPKRTRGAGHCPMGSPPCLAVPAGAVLVALLRCCISIVVEALRCAWLELIIRNVVVFI